MQTNGREAPEHGGSQPVFLLPAAVTALVGLIVAIHLASVFVFSEQAYLRFVVWFGFIPVRFTAPELVPGGLAPMLWTPFTYALLHGGWEHLIFNVAWLAIFGTPVARRYGGRAMLIVFFVGSLAGAMAYLALAWTSPIPLIGASGGIAALTGAAVRFVFQPVEVARHPETGEVLVLGRRLLPLGGLLRDGRAGLFSFFWLVLNGIVPLMPEFFGGPGVQIAWQAHIGGFVFGLLVVPLFERRPPLPAQDPDE